MTRPAVTPCETRTRCTATFGTAIGVELMMPPITPFIWPPGTPPITPPTTPDIGGGASSSLIISTFLGILVGVRSWLLTTSVSTTLMTLTGAAGGGGGGGGGGAARNVMVIALGSASVNISGIRIMMMMIPTCKTTANAVVRPRLVFNL